VGWAVLIIEPVSNKAEGCAMCNRVCRDPAELIRQAGKLLLDAIFKYASTPPPKEYSSSLVPVGFH
jgi:hypothetical protein